MAITLLTGAPGHGKSYAMCLEFVEALRKGKPVVTNLPLRPDWAEQVARILTPFGGLRKQRVQQLSGRLESMVFISDDLETLMRVRITGKGEGRAKILIDEAHRNLNPRAWDSATDEEGKPLKRAEAIGKRLKVIDHLSAHRHYGFDATLSSQDEKNLDAQVQRLYEFKAEVRNFKRLPFFGAIFRMNFFVKVTRWNDRARTKAGISVYFLKKRVANLYNTHALQELDWPEDAIVLHPHKRHQSKRKKKATQQTSSTGPADVSVLYSEHEQDQASGSNSDRDQETVG